MTKKFIDFDWVFVIRCDIVWQSDFEHRFSLHHLLWTWFADQHLRLKEVALQPSLCILVEDASIRLKQYPPILELHLVDGELVVEVVGKGNWVVCLNDCLTLIIECLVRHNEVQLDVFQVAFTVDWGALIADTDNEWFVPVQEGAVLTEDMAFRNVRWIVFNKGQLSEFGILCLIDRDGFSSDGCLVLSRQVEVSTRHILYLLEVYHLFCCTVVGKQHHLEIVKKGCGISVEDQRVGSPNVALDVYEGQDVKEHNCEAEPDGNQSAQTTHLASQVLVFIIQVETYSIREEIEVSQRLLQSSNNKFQGIDATLFVLHDNYFLLVNGYPGLRPKHHTCWFIDFVAWLLLQTPDCLLGYNWGNYVIP